jgi:hypothetical protein
VLFAGKELADMSITKNQLKAIVKECLVEILAEGMGSSVGSSINEAKKKSSQPHISTVLRKNASNTKIPTSALKEAIKREAGGNDVMADILSDTAANTLPKMLENDRSRIHQPVAHGAVEQIVANHAPQDLFGEEAASKWADLAFMGSSKNLK